MTFIKKEPRLSKNVLYFAIFTFFLILNQALERGRSRCKSALLRPWRVRIWSPKAPKFASRFKFVLCYFSWWIWVRIKAWKRGSSSRRKCIITAVKARLAEEENMHQVSMALRAFFTREMRTSRRKGRSRLLCTVAEFTQNSSIIIFQFINNMYCIIENKIISC